MNTTIKRIAVLLASMTMQLVLGVIYIWGVFQPFVVDTFGWSTTTSSLTFSIVLAFFVVGGIVGGRYQDKYSPRIVVIVSGLMIGAGVYLASFTQASNPYFLYGTYGVLAGSGIGAIYTTTIATAQKWFPDKKGLATGLVLSSLGFGGVVFTPLANMWLNSVGVNQTFVYFAIVFTIVCLLGAVFMFNPPKTQTAKGISVQKQYTTLEMLKTKSFYILMFTMMLSLPAYFMISPLIKVLGIDRGMSDGLATSAVMIAAILNSAGRVIAPVIAEKLGKKVTIIVLNTVSIAASVALVFSGSTFTLLMISVIALCFGGLLGIFPLISSNYFGTEHAGANYGFVLIGYGLAAIFAPKIYDISVAFSAWMPFVAVAVLSALASILTYAIRRPGGPTHHIPSSEQHAMQHTK